ncbi:MULTISPECIES: NAD-dependent protein deacylase [Actinomycetaceae]|uniref:NAD-dependent protein deacylase n=1 Tax=Actinomycetaceae TaxID=2049 RepID=UPI0001F14424|nr:MULTISPECIES: NAD-dependent protein deacylase [Actinomycetaceae]EFU60248.1 NAD-dependent deacetylase [Actinomyces sp. oral taxon 180 str. F0310]UUO92848.1 NAD-dependent protein deacylase [Schaalia odontolytica]
MSDDASTLAQWIDGSHDIVFFGGAGVSTESGIPDFRGAKGFYHQEREIPLERVLSIDFFSACPGAYYAWFAEQTAREGVAPNAAHRFLAGLERAGKLKAVVTQNIDGLHQAAGSKRVLELHGNWTRLECTGCGARSTIDDFDEARAGRVPHCPSCSAVVRPDIVFYGEALDPATLEGAVLAIAGADMLIVGGTSLAVYPAAGLIDYYQGGRLVLMNATPTPYDGRADLIIREPIGRVFAQIQGHV